MTAAVAVELLDLVNDHRATRGVAALVPDGALALAADVKSAEMARTGDFDHTVAGVSARQNLANAGYPVGTAAWGENIAYGYGTAAQVFAAWRGSDAHNRNMLNGSFRAIGIGLARDGEGVPYWTQTFGSVVVVPATGC